MADTMLAPKTRWTVYQCRTAAEGWLHYSAQNVEPIKVPYQGHLSGDH